MSVVVMAGVEAADTLTALFVVLVATAVGGAAFRRLGQPALVGQILAGVAVGPSLAGLVGPSEGLRVFAELGVVFLLFRVGLETRLSDLAPVARQAGLVGTLGVAFPFAGGLGLGLALGLDSAAALFLAAALVATSVGITSAVLVELGVLRTPASRTILGAAVVDDILAVMLLAAATGLAATGALRFMSLAVVVVLSVGFVAFFALGGTALVRRRPHLLGTSAEAPLIPAVIVCLGLAALAARIGLAAIIGAFLAGLIVAESRDRVRVEREVARLHAFFPPFFFGSIGVLLDLGAILRRETLLLLLLVTAVAVATKLAGAALGALSLGGRDALFVGLGMVPRGEVGIVVASLGHAAGVVDGDLFAVIVGMAVATTLPVPPLLRLVVSRERALRAGHRPRRREPAAASVPRRG